MYFASFKGVTNVLRMVQEGDAGDSVTLDYQTDELMQLSKVGHFKPAGQRRFGYINELRMANYR